MKTRLGWIVTGKISAIKLGGLNSVATFLSMLRVQTIANLWELNINNPEEEKRRQRIQSFRLFSSDR